MEILQNSGLGDDSLDMIPKDIQQSKKQNKKKNKIVLLQRKTSARKRSQQNEKSTYRRGENIFKQHI